MIYFKHAHRYLVLIYSTHTCLEIELYQLLAICCYKSQYMYEYIIKTETPLSELKISPNCKDTSARLTCDCSDNSDIAIPFSVKAYKSLLTHVKSMGTAETCYQYMQY